MFYSLKTRLEFSEGKANLNVGYVPKPEPGWDGKEAFREEEEVYKFEN